MNENLRRENEPEEQINKIERIYGPIDQETLKQIAEVESACFPEQIAEDEEELKVVLENPNGIHLKSTGADGRIFGYISSLEHNQEFDLLKEHDSELKEEKDALYIHSFDIVPEKRNLKAFNELWKKLEEEATNEGYKKLTMYARVSNKLSDVLQKRYGAKFFRRIKNWRGLGEDFDYLEKSLESEK